MKDERERQEAKVREELAKSEHALSNGILCAINAVSDVKRDVAEISASTIKIQKVIIGDPEYHTKGLIEDQRLHHEAALIRHKEVMDKITALENTRIIALEESMLKIKTWGAAAFLAWGFICTIIVKIIEHLFFKN